MILKQERVTAEIHREAPKIGVPFKGVEKNATSQFYKYDSSLSGVVVGYRKGPKNPYVEKLMEM